MAKVVDSVDRFQRRHAVVSMPLGVIYKFFEDQGNYLASIVTYYAFIAIFPLMLLASSILGFVLQDNPELQATLLDSALAQFPIIGDQLGRPEGLRGSAGAIVIGGLAALYGAVGLGQAIQNVSNTAWSIPRNKRPNPLKMRAKSLVLLLTAGLAVVAVVVVSSVLTNSEVLAQVIGTDVRWVVTLASILVVGAVMSWLFRLASAGDHTLRHALPGGFFVAVMWQGLQYAGAAYVSAVLVNTSSMNQTFGLVLGLIGIIYIASVMAVLGIELNVVLARKLYPRALLTPFTDRVHLTDADRRAYAALARAQRLKGFQTVDVTFEEEKVWQQRSAEPAPVAPAPAEPAPAEPAPAEQAPPAERTEQREQRERPEQERPRERAD